MNFLAICIQCGETKKAAYQKCNACGFDPAQREEDLVKSVYLSVGRYEDEEDRQRYLEELRLMGRTLREGDEMIEYDPLELNRLEKQRRVIDAIPTSAPWGAVLRFLLPGIILLAILWFAIFLLRR